MPIQDPNKPTRRNKRRELQGAVDRGIIDKDDAQFIVPTRRRRTCPACGSTFLPFDVGHRGFCCSCCAYDWGELNDHNNKLRDIESGDRIIRIVDGRVGHVIETQTPTEAVIEVDKEQMLITIEQVEKIQFLDIQHRQDCLRGKVNPFGWSGKTKDSVRKEMAEAEEE